MNTPDAYAHPLFNKNIDKVTGFRTRNMLTCPIKDAMGKTVAVLQALNKVHGQSFTSLDERNLNIFGTHLGNSLAKAKLHEQAEREKDRLSSLFKQFKLLSTAVGAGACCVAGTRTHPSSLARPLVLLCSHPPACLQPLQKDLSQVLAVVIESMHESLLAQHAFVFIVDHPRSELWMQSSIPGTDQFLAVRWERLCSPGVQTCAEEWGCNGAE